MSKLNEMDYNVVLDISGITVPQDIAESGLVDTKSIKKSIIDGIPRYTVNMIGTTMNKQSINGLTFDPDEARHMLRNELVITRLKNDNLHCEMNHPFTTDVKRLRSVDLNNVSHRIREFFFSPGDEHLCVKLTTSQQQAGRNLAYFLEDGSAIALSMRAHAQAMRINGAIKKDVHFTSYDAVWFASNRESYSERGLGISEGIDSINVDRALAFGTTPESLIQAKLTGIETINEINNKNKKKIDLLESYLFNEMVRGTRLVDISSRNIDQTIKEIAESSGALEMNGVTHLLVDEISESVIFVGGNITTTAKVARSMYNDILNDVKKRSFK